MSWLSEQEWLYEAQSHSVSHERVHKKSPSSLLLLPRLPQGPFSRDAGPNSVSIKKNLPLPGGGGGKPLIAALGQRQADL